MISPYLKSIIVEYVDGKISLAEMEVSIVSKLTTLLEDPDSDDAKAVSEIEAVLAELYARNIDEHELVVAMRRIRDANQNVT